MFVVLGEQRVETSVFVVIQVEFDISVNDRNTASESADSMRKYRRAHRNFVF